MDQKLEMLLGVTLVDNLGDCLEKHWAALLAMLMVDYLADKLVGLMAS